MAASEVYRMVSATVHHSAKSTSPTGSARPMVVPAPVATALPPLKPKNTDQQAPITAASATAATTHPLSVTARASTTGTNPLSMSPSMVRAAGHLPALRRTLAMPMFPLPSLRSEEHTSELQSRQY